MRPGYFCFGLNSTKHDLISAERRLVGESEFPLLLRVRLGPREDIAKLFLLDKNKTQEINHEVAQFLK